MKIIYTNYTDMGNPWTPKGLEPEYLGKEIIKNKNDLKILCRGISKERTINIDKKYIYTPIPFGNILPKILTFFEKKFRIPGRYYSSLLFEHFASKQIKDCDLLICGIPSQIKQMEKAKSQNIKTFVIATSAHIKFVQKLMKEEYENHGLTYFNKDLKIFEETNSKSYENADLIFARSEYNKMTLIDSGISPHKIYPEPVDVFFNSKKFKPKRIKKDKIFRAIYVGQVSFAKGSHYLLEAWKNLNLKNSELILCGGIETALKNKFPDLFELNNVKYLGHTDPLNYLQNSDIFCFPSLTEGCPQAIVEAMACGLPVIATTHSGSLARENKEGYVVPIRDVRAFEEKIKVLYENDKLRHKLSNNCIKRAKEFGIENYSKNLYKKIIKGYNSILKQ